jgi:oligoendopeptidase F
MENDFRATISIRRDQAARLAADLLTFANNQEEQDTTDWKQELRDFINDKSKKYDMPRDKHGYANLMAQLAANNEIDRKRLDALIARTTEEIRKREEQDNG